MEKPIELDEGGVGRIVDEVVVVACSVDESVVAEIAADVVVVGKAATEYVEEGLENAHPPSS